MPMEVNVLVQRKCTLGEGPVYNAGTGQLVWVDILEGNIHEYALTDHIHASFAVHDMIGAVALCENGDYLAALKKGLALIRKGSHAVEYLVDPEAHLENNRFNDGKCDPQGRFWFGSMHLLEEAGAGALYMWDGMGQVHRKRDAVSVSNGLAWTADAQTMYYIDSPTRQVTAFDFDGDTGAIHNPRPVIRFSEGEGYPDGMCIDAEGMLWIAHWDGFRVSRWDAKSGQKLTEIRLPVARVTSCCFGGEDLSRLYITTARIGLSEKELEEQPLAGAVFEVAHPAVSGAAVPRFKG